jgi:hypothetical protein
MDVCCVYVFFCVCVVLYLGRGLATNWSLIQGVLSIVNRSGDWKKRPGSTRAVEAFRKKKHVILFPDVLSSFQGRVHGTANRASGDGWEPGRAWHGRWLTSRNVYLPKKFKEYIVINIAVTFIIPRTWLKSRSVKFYHQSYKSKHRFPLPPWGATEQQWHTVHRGETCSAPFDINPSQWHPQLP